MSIIINECNHDEKNEPSWIVMLKRLMKFSRMWLYACSRQESSSRHVEKKRRVEKGKRKEKKQRSWQREYVPRFLSRGISWMIAGDLLEPYWYLSNLESYGAAVGVRSISRKVDTQILAHPCVIQEIRRLEKSLAVHCLIVLLPRTFPPIWPLRWNDSFGSCILVQWRKKEKKKKIN